MRIISCSFSASEGWSKSRWGVIEELGDEERDGQFVGMKRDGGEGCGQPYVAQLLQLHLRAHVNLRLEDGQRLEELFLYLGMGCLGDVHHQRQSSMRLGEHIHDHSRFAVLERMQYNGLCLCQHTDCKGTNK